MRREADAGATGTLLWDVAPNSQREAMGVVFQAPAVPGFLVMAHPRLGDARISKLRHALPDFGRTPDGRAYFKDTQQVDFRPLDDATMKLIDPFVAVLTQPR